MRISRKILKNFDKEPIVFLIKKKIYRIKIKCLELKALKMQN